MAMLTMEWWLEGDKVHFHIVDQTERQMDECGPSILLLSSIDGQQFIASYAEQALELVGDDIFHLYVRGFVEDEEHVHICSKIQWEHIRNLVFRYNKSFSNNTLEMEDVIWERIT